MKRKLFLIHSENQSSDNYSVEFEISTLEDFLEIRFFVTSTSNSWNISESFSHDPRKNWGLWEKDVVEVFWQNRNDSRELNAPYYEWQTSPNHKNFCLEITKVRTSFHTPLQCPVQFEPGHWGPTLWHTAIKIPRSFYSLFDHHYLGLFAILGPPSKRQYYSMHPQKMDKPDFHRPEFFLPLSTLS
jgi:hypothetical protein